MRIRRGLLFWGLFLIPLGAIPLLVRAGVLDATRLTDVWRLWPVVLILIGLSVLLGRRQAGLVAVVVAALALGGLGGSALASGVSWPGSVGVCSGSGEDMEVVQADGQVDGGMADLTLELDCGSIDVTTATGTAWRVEARYRGPVPEVRGVGESLAIADGGSDLRDRQEWTVVVPDRVDRIDLQANAARSDLALGQATVRQIRAFVNAGDLVVDASAAALDRLDLELNAGRARVAFGTSTTSGVMSVNAGALELCVPSDMGLRIHVDEQLTFAHDLDSKGLELDGDVWTRAPTFSGQTIELAIDGNAASLTLDPEEGCT